MIREMIPKIHALIFFLALSFPLPAQGEKAPRGRNPYAEILPKLVRFQQPEWLTYDQLTQLADTPRPTGELKRKVDTLLRKPFISNEAAFRGARPREPYDPRFGKFLRVMSWNIEKSMKLDEAILAFTHPQGFGMLIDTGRFPPGSVGYEEALTERYLLSDVDVIILQEMDMGMKRSGYKNSPKELAEALAMNYVYAPAYLEIDRVNLGIERFQNPDGTYNRQMEELIAVDPKRYLGMFGSAVLSRYPILDVQVIPLKHQGYDWYEAEKQKVSLLETARRETAETVFVETLLREMKIGGRHFFRVDLYMPALPEKKLTLINVHLEIKCLPQARESEIQEILTYIKDIRNPVVMAGDFNAAPGDLSPTTVRREARRLAANPSFWFSQAIRMAMPQGLALDVSRVFSNITKNFQNPTAPHIPVIAPNKLQRLFQIIREFRFADGYVFDYRGDPNRSMNWKRSVLANSNERDRIGFKMTFTTERTILNVVGKYRLDWMFVKSYITDPRAGDESYRFAPHFGRTLEAMNDRLIERISDHHPNIVDLPFEEPRITND
jgi:endonuclease/exonuclease/phosphatase family metal-dependent hydrolase